MPHLRIFNNTLLGHKTQVFYIDEDGKEIELSGCLTEVSFTASVHNINEVTLTMTAHADYDVKANLKALLEKT